MVHNGILVAILHARQLFIARPNRMKQIIDRYALQSDTPLLAELFRRLYATAVERLD